MAEHSGSAPAGSEDLKGKGKDAAEDVSMGMDDDDSSSDEETGAEEEVCDRGAEIFSRGFVLMNVAGA